MGTVGTVGTKGIVIKNVNINSLDVIISTFVLSDGILLPFYSFVIQRNYTAGLLSELSGWNIELSPDPWW